MKTIVIIILSFGCLFNGCTIFRGIYAPKSFTYKYDGEYTGIDTLIFTNGYYKIQEPKYDYAGKPFYSNLLFYENGLVCYAIADNASVIFKEGLYPVSAWGSYQIIADTIKCQFITDDGVMSGINISKRNYIIDSKSQISEINIHEINLRYSFQPLDSRIGYDNWLLKKKWFWEKGYFPKK